MKTKVAIGQRFGKLTILSQAETINGHYKWNCLCDCGREKLAYHSSLIRNATKTCGKCPTNTYKIIDDYVVGYTSKGEKFYFDLEDLQLVKSYSWSNRGKGYMRSSTYIELSRLIMSPDKSLVVDHINHNVSDNRKSNLRICSRAENGRNTSKTKGYTYDKKRNKYIAQIRFNYKHINLGYFNTPEEARKVYITKAKELFGEFASISLEEVL